MAKRRRVIVMQKPTVRQIPVDGLPRSILASLAKGV